MPEPIENYVDHVLDKNGTSYELRDTDCRTIANSKTTVKNQTETASYENLVVDETLVDSSTFTKMTIKNTAARCIYYQGDGTTATATNAADFHDAILKAYNAGTGVKKTVGFQVRYTNTDKGDELLIPATQMFTDTGSANGVVQFFLPTADGSSLILVVDTYTIGDASDGSADTHTITTQPIGGGGGSSVDKYDITLTVYPTGIAHTPTPRFDKCNGYTTESDITTQLHNLYTALTNGEHPIVTLNFLFSFNDNTLKTLCPVSVTPIDSTWLCFTWENSVPPASPSGGGLPATRYVHMCYVNHTGVRRYSYTQKTYSLS